MSFESRVEMHQILNGLGNIDKYTDQASGKPYEGLALRLFNPATRLWSIYWADINSGSLDPPLVGSFENKIGHFFARDTYKGRPIIVVFRWDVRNPSLPVGVRPSPPMRQDLGMELDQCVGARSLILKVSAGSQFETEKS
jgi:hypothetical protein